MKKIVPPRSVSYLIPLVFILLIFSEIDVPILGFWELKTRDLRVVLRGKEKSGGKVAILAIDEKSLDRLGRWPWSRSVIAKAVGLLKQGGAKSVALDLLFSEPETPPDHRILRELIADYTKSGLLGDTPESQAFFSRMVAISEQKDNDTLLADEIHSAKNVVLPMAFADSDTVSDEIPQILTQIGYPISELPEDFEIVHFNGYVLPLSQFTEASPRLGFVNVLSDSDGAVRRSLALIRHDRLYFLSLPIRTVQRHFALRQKDVFLMPENKEIRMDTLKIPMNSDGTFYINHYGPNGTIPYYSFAEFIDGAISPEEFRGKTVFIGGTAIGLGDHWATPFGAGIAGVEIQATVADNILTQRYLLRPSWAKYADMLIVILSGIFLINMLFCLSIAWCVPFSVMTMIVFMMINQVIFAHYRLILLWVYPIMNLMLLTTHIFLQRYFIEGREKKLLKQAFQQYLSPSVVNRIIESPENLSLGGEKKELTVLFSDIRRFTTISESLDPERLVRFMNRYLTDMTKVIMDCEGTLDKYIGDAIMAIYGAPAEQKDHAIHACSSAIRMFDILYRRRDIWKTEGIPDIRIGIGINTGNMVVGNIGSEKRFNYTVMGDHVNLASRLEGLTKIYGVKIIVSEYTWEKAKDHFEFRELDIVRVRGRNEPLKIFELLGKDYFTHGDYAFIPIFHEGLDAYRKCEWERAIRRFEECLVFKPDDNPAQLYIGRCNEIIRSPQSKDFDGIYSCDEK